MPYSFNDHVLQGCRYDKGVPVYLTEIHIYLMNSKLTFTLHLQVFAECNIESSCATISHQIYTAVLENRQPFSAKQIKCIVLLMTCNDYALQAFKC